MLCTINPVFQTRFAGTRDVKLSKFAVFDVGHFYSTQRKKVAGADESEKENAELEMEFSAAVFKTSIFVDTGKAFWRVLAEKCFKLVTFLLLFCPPK